MKKINTSTYLHFSKILYMKHTFKHCGPSIDNCTMIVHLSKERNPFSANNQTLRSYRVPYFTDHKAQFKSFFPHKLIVRLISWCA